MRTCAKQVEQTARKALRGARCREFDEEDVTAAVMNSLFVGLRDGRITEIAIRRHLLRLLQEMARRKSAEAQRKQRAKRRGEGKVRGDSGFEGVDPRLGSRGIDGVASEVPDPAEALSRAEAFTYLLRKLEKPELREIATLKIAKFTNAEIAHRLGVTERTIERKVAAIREVFGAELERKKKG